MKLKILDIAGKETGSRELPLQFKEKIEPDLIARAVLAMQANKRQPYGAKPDAGKRASAKLSRRRRNYRGSYGIGISRVPRKILTRRGRRFFWVGAFAPGTVGGRRAHPPKAEKVWEQKINKKERRKAIRSALSAVVEKNTVKLRGHLIPEAYPFAVASDFEGIKKTKDVFNIFSKLGFAKELERTNEKKIRAGKGKMRGRKYKTKKGILLVVSGDCSLIKASKNIPGVDVAKVNELNAELLAPGAKPGRATIFTDRAIEKIEKENLFR